MACLGPVDENNYVQAVLSSTVLLYARSMFFSDYVNMPRHASPCTHALDRGSHCSLTGCVNTAANMESVLMLRCQDCHAAGVTILC